MGQCLKVSRRGMHTVLGRLEPAVRSASGNTDMPILCRWASCCLLLVDYIWRVMARRYGMHSAIQLASSVSNSGIRHERRTNTSTWTPDSGARLRSYLHGGWGFGGPEYCCLRDNRLTACFRDSDLTSLSFNISGGAVQHSWACVSAKKQGCHNPGSDVLRHDLGGNRSMFWREGWGPLSVFWSFRPTACVASAANVHISGAAGELGLLHGRDASLLGWDDADMEHLFLSCR